MAFPRQNAYSCTTLLNFESNDTKDTSIFRTSLLQSFQRLKLATAKEVLQTACSALSISRDAKQNARNNRASAIHEMHVAIRKQWLQSKAKAHQDRMLALKSNDVEEYLKLVSSTKSSKIQELLAGTDACLRKLTERLQKVTLTLVMPTHELIESEGLQALRESNVCWNAMTSAISADVFSQPSLLVKGQLREYQLQGLRWMLGLRDNHLNGILADEMGLGKTIQVISLVAYLIEREPATKPFLVAVPSSVLPNWESEFKAWAPSIQVLSYKGTPEEREKSYRTKMRQGRRKFHVCLTTYTFLMGDLDKQRLSCQPWAYIIVDEAHRLKNSGCKLNAELRQYTSDHRLLLTGTPLSNCLEELWSLLHFLMPTLFDSNLDFDGWFGGALKPRILSRPDDCEDVEALDAAMLSEEENLLVTNRLHQVLRPFMLRRLKEAVAGELPSKEERLLTCAPSAYQSYLFQAVRRQLSQKGKKGISINNVLMELRNICNHPMLSKLHPEGGERRHLSPHHHVPAEVRLCSKLELLDRVLVKLHASKHKVLIFCTMTRALDIIEEHMYWRGFPMVRLDGSTPAAERSGLIEKFNDPKASVFAFLLSFRAGGVGLNLQAADTVICYDTEFNPQIDAQAQARCHRIGQTRSVLVLRLQTIGTVEERICQVALQKKGLADASITGGFFDGMTQPQERQRLLLDILAQHRVIKSSDHAREMTDGQLNELLARSEEEIEIFNAEDKRLQGLEGARDRLAATDQIQGLISEVDELIAPPVEEDLENMGRGKRVRRAASLKEMTDKEFNRMCKEGKPITLCL